VEESRVELVKNRLILGQFYSTLLYSPLHFLNPNRSLLYSITVYLFLLMFINIFLVLVPFPSFIIVLELPYEYIFF